jgi:hypothetical protein
MPPTSVNAMSPSRPNPAAVRRPNPAAALLAAAVCLPAGLAGLIGGGCHSTPKTVKADEYVGVFVCTREEGGVLEPINFDADAVRMLPDEKLGDGRPKGWAVRTEDDAAFTALFTRYYDHCRGLPVRERLAPGGVRMVAHVRGDLSRPGRFGMRGRQTRALTVRQVIDLYPFDPANPPKGPGSPPPRKRPEVDAGGADFDPPDPPPPGGTPKSATPSPASSSPPTPGSSQIVPSRPVPEPGK